MKNLIVVTASMLVASSLISATPGAPITGAAQQSNTQSMLSGDCIRKQPTLKQRIKASWKHFGLAAVGLFAHKGFLGFLIPTFIVGVKETYWDDRICKVALEMHRDPPTICQIGDGLGLCEQPIIYRDKNLIKPGNHHVVSSQVLLEDNRKSRVRIGFYNGLPTIQWFDKINVIDTDYPPFIRKNIWTPWYLFSAYYLYKGIQAFINPNSALSSQQTTTTPAVAQPAA